MTIELEAGKWYETFGGERLKCLAAFDGKNYQASLEREDGNLLPYTMNGEFIPGCRGSAYDIHREIPNPTVEREEIDVAGMWVGICRASDGWFAGRKCDTKQQAHVSMLALGREVVAVVTVRDWHDICQGKRKLIVGEGLE